jgi:beta-glucosidase
MTRITFPAGFQWGVATSSYQIEGSPLEDGACPSIWHEFAHKRGRIRDGSTGDVASDHYHRWAEDIQIMKGLGLGAYRFSIAWPRIFPAPGSLNQKGIDFYSRIVDGLLSAGITPYATLFHWDEPSWLERAGGFVERSSIDRFLEYGAAVMERLGDRVKNWITLNEPSLFSFFGYGTGEFAPGRKRDLRAVYHVAHHLLLAHARMVEAFPSLVKNGRIGIAHHFVWVSAKNPPGPRDAEAAAFMDDAANRFFMDPLFFGRYPQRVVSRLRRFLPKSFEKDLSEMAGKRGDFFGLNYYTRNEYRYALLQPYMHAREVIDPRLPRSAMWEIYPAGMGKSLIRLRDEYGNPPCFITENGFPLVERAGRDPLDDRERIDYLSSHLAEVGKAIADGVDCRGYFHWTLMDNWEWGKGFEMRFGLVRTDFANQKRTWKASASWYRELAHANALEVESLPASDDDS